MSRIRVLRVMEYSYDTFDHMIGDMVSWQVAGDGISHFDGVTIRSSTISLKVLPVGVVYEQPQEIISENNND